MKLTTGLNILRQQDFKKKISKKITLANTNDRVIDEKAIRRSEGVSNDPLYNDNAGFAVYNPDIRFRQDFSYNPLTGINYRNDLLLFAENDEIKQAVEINANEVCIMESDMNRYPVFPELSQILIEKDKQQTAQAIQDYLDKIFYPKLFQWYNFKEEGLVEIVKEYLITGKLCYEIIYDNLKNPKDIIGLQPLDASTLQKFKQDNQIFYVQKAANIGGQQSHERVLHENQVILIEWNPYDYGYVSYVDKLRRPFNIMRSMETSKVLWFAAKSQVRMHIKLNMGDISRTDAIKRLSEARHDYSTTFSFTEDGKVLFNNQPNNIGYREFFTAETSGGGTPEIEEVNSNGPDLTETDSLNLWDKRFWKASQIPIDRVDPNSTESWGFADVNNLRKIEVNYGKFINKIRKQLNPLFLKPIIIQLTLKETEIGVDLSLLDSIKMRWIAFNQYEMMAELEVLNKRVELAQNIAQFGEYQDANDRTRKAIPLSWVVKQFFDFSKEQLDSMEEERIRENIMLGFNPDGSMKEEGGEEGLTSDEEDFAEEDMGAPEEPAIVEMVQLGEISEEELIEMIEQGKLTEEEEQALIEAGLYPNEDIASADDKNFE